MSHAVAFFVGVVGVVGGVVGCLIVTYERRQRAILEAEKMTEELREAETALKEALAASTIQPKKPGA